MEGLSSSSSSFLQKYAHNHSLTPPPPLVLALTISSAKTTDEKYVDTVSSSGIGSSTTPLTYNLTTSHKNRLKSDGEIKGRRKKSLLAIIFNSLDNLICDFLDPPLAPAFDPTHVLSGNFAPVEELPPTSCQVVQGSLPPSLTGAYIRNGPNPQFIPRGPYHLFDGDGMLHSLTISGGRANFCSRFVHTYKYQLERDVGSPVILKVFSAFNGFRASMARCALAFLWHISGHYDPTRGVGGANTSLALIGGKLFALEESDLPYRLKLTPDGDVITLGRHESFGEPFMTMTAHPKIDAETGDAFAFRYSIRRPFLSYFRINSEGIKEQEVPIYSLSQPSLIHDFAITKNYAIFPDSQMVISPMEILKGRPPLRIDKGKVSRLGIIGRYAEDGEEMRWVEAPGLNLMHAANAWEEDGGDTIVMVGSDVAPVEHVLERIDLAQSSMERIEIDLKAKSVSRRKLSLTSLDFPVINPAYVAKKNRYVYAAVGAPMPKIGGVVKIDLSLSTTDAADCTVASRLYGPGCHGGEPFFVAREPDNPAAEEDDGYLVLYVHDENIQESKFVVMDAKSPTLDIIAAVKLPQRTPNGFHGLFVSENDLKHL
uniref:Carotenoid cleavage dioxygenase 4 n=1 Tax=Scutellaria baicalensis TaxID=65409 RepID=R9S1P3_SCUBA|nr:carotenoid cleavage dioxygenase 4 [Scutellaria baicalensis]